MLTLNGDYRFRSSMFDDNGSQGIEITLNDNKLSTVADVIEANPNEDLFIYDFNSE